eukprot:1188828-Prorocentrum_minimum.AAC.2
MGGSYLNRAAGLEGDHCGRGAPCVNGLGLVAELPALVLPPREQSLPRRLRACVGVGGRTVEEEERDPGKGREGKVYRATNSALSDRGESSPQQVR